MTGPGALMVCGTGSDTGKSTVVGGLCRLLARRGLSVAPFKAQNMALNSAVTASGHEIGRAQAAQAAAAMVEPEVSMNPVLLKPTGPRTSQVVVSGRPWATLDAVAYQRAKAELWPVVLAALEGLRARFDVVVCEGAGSPAEINLLEHDITNLRVAAETGIPAVIVGDIDRGGVFASLYGTVALLPEHLASCVRAFVVNKFRGDRSILDPGLEELERRTGRPTLGLLPWMDGLSLDAEDSMALRSYSSPGRHAGSAGAEASLDVAVVALPRISNFTDLDALALEDRVTVRMVSDASAVGSPDLLVLPGTKSTVADLAWLRERRLDRAVVAASTGPSTVLGICGGYQMLGERIDDAVESSTACSVEALGLLRARTTFREDKTTRRVSGEALGEEVRGYEIHHGVTEADGHWVRLGTGPEGSAAGAVLGTSVHGLFENDGFRRRFLALVAGRSGTAWEPGPPVSFAAARERQFDTVADAIEEYLDVATLMELIDP